MAVPMNCSNRVNRVFSVSGWSMAAALAMPKSITFGTGRLSCKVTRMFDGLMSLVDDRHFWWACWMAWQTGMKRSRRCCVERLFWSQYSVIGTPRTNSIIKERSTRLRCARHRGLSDVGMIHQSDGLAFGLEAGDDLFGVHAQLDDLEGDAAADRHFLLGHPDAAHAAFTDFLEQLVPTDAIPSFLGERLNQWLVGHRRGFDGYIRIDGIDGLHRASQDDFDALEQGVIICTRTFQIGGAFIFRVRNNSHGVEDLLFA